MPDQNKYNTNKNLFFCSTKCVEREIEVLMVTLKYFENYIYVCGFLKSGLRVL